MHGRVGDTLVGSFADLAAEHPEVVAEHMKQAGWLERAIPFSIDAGRKASNRYELTEAIVDFRAALDALSALPDHSDKAALELETLLLLGLTVRNAHGYYEAELQPIYERARTLAEDLERPDALASATYGLWTHAAGPDHRDSRAGLGMRWPVVAGLLSAQTIGSGQARWNAHGVAATAAHMTSKLRKRTIKIFGLHFVVDLSGQLWHDEQHEHQARPA